MKTILIRPTNPGGSAYLTKWGFLPAPLGLLQLAGSLLTLDDSEVKVLDMEADPQRTVESVVKETISFKPDIVGLTIHATAAHATATEIAKRVKEEKSDALLLAGGHHATFVPYDLLRNGFDIVARGEGDQTVVDIVTALRNGSSFEEIPGIFFRRKGDGKNRTALTMPRALIPDLDSLALPALHLVKKRAIHNQGFRRRERRLPGDIQGLPLRVRFLLGHPDLGAQVEEQVKQEDTHGARAREESRLRLDLLHRRHFRGLSKRRPEDGPVRRHDRTRI